MKKYKINKGFIAQKIEDKTVIFDGEESVLYTLNNTSSFIFNKLKLGWDKEKIINGLIKIYKVKKERAERDVEENIAKMINEKIIKIF